MRINRRYEQSEEFRGRQARFDFAEVAHAVIDIALYVREQGRAMLKKMFPAVRSVLVKPQQLILNLNGVSMTPSYGG